MEGSLSLSLSLDEAALEVMEALELLQERRERLEEHLRQGWLSLAQARYSLGCHRVSSLQYGATMEPRVRVSHRQDPGGRPHFEEVPGTGGDPEDPQEGEGDGLRQRRRAPEKGGTPARAPPDPLGWFGVLVPPSLRQAQGSFQRGVTLAVEVAELQGTVDAAATKYRHLLRQKRLLAGDRGDRGDSETPGDTETSGDRGDSETPGDTETPRDSESPGDSETLGDSETPRDTETPGDIKSQGDIEGDTASAGDTGTA